MEWWQSIDWRLTTEVLSLALALIALVIGAYHLVEIRRTSKSLSTRYIGEFPFFLPEINEVLNSAKHDIVIFCDFPGYGDFSDPPNALEYRQILETQIQRGVVVELVCMDEDKRSRYAAEQLSAAQWDNWIAQPRNRDRAMAFMSAHAGAPPSQLVTFDQLKVAMEAEDQRILARVFQNRAIQLPIDMPIYFWIADKRTAIFSIPALSDEAQEYGFRTSDRASIQALLEIRLRFRRRFNALMSASTPQTTTL